MNDNGARQSPAATITYRRRDRSTGNGRIGQDATAAARRILDLAARRILAERMAAVDEERPCE